MTIAEGFLPRFFLKIESIMWQDNEEEKEILGTLENNEFHVSVVKKRAK